VQERRVVVSCRDCRSSFTDVRVLWHHVTFVCFWRERHALKDVATEVGAHGQEPVGSVVP
jgi:hypothetical protein